MILNDKTASGRIIGRVLYIEKSGEYVYNQRTERIEINRNLYNPRFIYHLLNAPEMRNKIIKQSQGNTQIFVNWNGIKNTEYLIPDLSEQSYLEKIFNNIDNLITLHQRKWICIFYSWEQRKVTDIGNISIGLVTTMTKHYTDSGTLLIRNSDIKDNKFEFSESPIFLDKEFAEKNKSRQHRIGDVITVHTGDVGTSAVITENEANSIGFATIITRPNKNIITSNYLSTFLNTEKHKKWAVAISTGDGRTNYNLGDYYKLVLPVPNILEQEKISDFILKLDNLITLHQH